MSEYRGLYNELSVRAPTGAFKKIYFDEAFEFTLGNGNLFHHSLFPYITNSVDLGSNALRWRNFYAQTLDIIDLTVNGTLYVNTILERTAANGVNIENINVQDLPLTDFGGPGRRITFNTNIYVESLGTTSIDIAAPAAVLLRFKNVDGSIVFMDSLLNVLFRVDALNVNVYRDIQPVPGNALTLGTATARWLGIYAQDAFHRYVRSQELPNDYYIWFNTAANQITFQVGAWVADLTDVGPGVAFTVDTLIARTDLVVNTIYPYSGTELEIGASIFNSNPAQSLGTVATPWGSLRATDVYTNTVRPIAPAADIECAEDYVPTVDATYDLGSGAQRWKDVYISGSIIGGGGFNAATIDTTVATANLEHPVGFFVNNGTAAQVVYTQTNLRYNASTSVLSSARFFTPVSSEPDNPSIRMFDAQTGFYSQSGITLGITIQGVRKMHVTNGAVAIGTPPTEYILPIVRGTNKQLLITDATGLVTWRHLDPPYAHWEKTNTLLLPGFIEIAVTWQTNHAQREITLTGGSGGTNFTVDRAGLYTCSYTINWGGNINGVERTTWIAVNGLIGGGNPRYARNTIAPSTAIRHVTGTVTFALLAGAYVTLYTYNDVGAGVAINTDTGNVSRHAHFNMVWVGLNA